MPNPELTADDLLDALTELFGEDKAKEMAKEIGRYESENDFGKELLRIAA